MFVNHGHVLVNGKSVNKPAYSVDAGDVVELKEKSKALLSVKASMDSAQSRIIPEWLTLDKEQVRGTVNSLPTRDQLPSTITEQLIVELYSR